MTKATTRKTTIITGTIIIPKNGMGHQSGGIAQLPQVRRRTTSVTLPLAASRPST